ncbi:methyl-accepting chemotaxis protein [Paraburkholderia sp. DHOC27]|uniref:methyl-accepting chemotaxis protein n=1 Tax=Paraburkholderia sp. DHOC27 TaxID=2303330 RepID=UPI000E3B5951|nr:methyl-accepting chemotaxis protein [Paraburkholderia sp. DHOC27]RFU44743.1 methyl-accepting chemotaxis protein [Paraburkholderia sp. DHOC27]
MSNLTVRSRLVFVTAAVGFVLLVTGAAAFIGVTRGTDALQRMFEGRAKDLQVISSIDELVADTRFSVSDAILDPSEQKTRLVTEATASRVQQVDALMAQYLANTSNGNESRLATQFSSSWAALRDKGLRPAVQLLTANNLSEAQWVETQTIEAATRSVRAQGAALRNLELSVAQQEYDDARASGHVAQVVIALFVVGGLGVVALICAALARGLFRELGGEPHVAAEVARRVAGGDLSIRVPIAPDDKRSVLSAMAAMRERLAAMIGDIRSSTESITEASAGIAAGNTLLAGRTQDQAAGIQQTSATMEQLASTVKANAERAEQAHALVRVASSKAEDGNRATRDAVERMSELTQRSGRVREITSVIEGISFQTNLLALNAAVEAARAGSHGRGFAVVAQEVRALAERSSRAAREIDGLIKGMTAEVDLSGVAVNKAGVSIVELIETVNGVSKLVESIASASSEQSVGIDQVNAAVTTMDHTTQKNASFAQDGVQAASALETQAQSLRAAVRAFQL